MYKIEWDRTDPNMPGTTFNCELLKLLLERSLILSYRIGNPTKMSNPGDVNGHMQLEGHLRWGQH